MFDLGKKQKLYVMVPNNKSLNSAKEGNVKLIIDGIVSFWNRKR